MLQYEKCLFLSIVLFSDSIRYNFLLNIFDTVITNVSIFYGAIKYNFDFSFDQKYTIAISGLIFCRWITAGQFYS